MLYLKKESEELFNAIKRLSNSYKYWEVVKRGVINGLFTALGATVGIAILFSLIIGIYSGLRGVPVINQFMNLTGLDQVVEYVIEQKNEKI